MFNFSEIVTLLIDHFQRVKGGTTDIVQLNRILFELFQREANITDKWNGKYIPLLNKKQEILLATKLYFGKDYGEDLTELLYAYDVSKIVAPLSTFMEDDRVSPKWKKYLQWAGVADRPRQLSASLNDPIAFGDYCMKNYNYQNIIENYKFHDYSDFAKHYSSYKKNNYKLD